MPTVTKRGTTQPLLQYWETSSSLAQGVNSTMEFKGMDLSAMSAKCAEYVNAGWDGKLRFERDVATLTLTRAVSILGNSGGTNPFNTITDRWEVGVDQERPELFENPNFIACVDKRDTFYFRGSDQVFNVIRSVASSGNATWKDFWAAARATKLTDSTGADLPSGATVAALLLDIHSNWPEVWSDFTCFVFDYFRGRTNFLRGKYVLKHTTLAPSDYAANVADFNVERIYSIAQLLTEAQSSALWVLPLPGYLAYKILAYPVPATMPPNYMWGALKTRSNAVTAAQGRIEINTEYLIDACPIHTYGLAS